MNQKITVLCREQYGTTRYYPMCQTSQAFADIAHTKTLTRDDLDVIEKRLGFQVVFKYPNQYTR